MDGTTALPNGQMIHDLEGAMGWAGQSSAEEAPAKNPLAPLARAMRGRWLVWLALSVVLGGALGAAGYFTGTQIFDSQAVLRVYPSESGILYNSGDDSVLKTFDSFVKAETAFANSPEVMSRAVDLLKGSFPELTADLVVADLRQSVAVKRSDTLIVLDTKSKDADFAAAKLNAVTAAYLALKNESEARQVEQRSVELTRREAELLEQLQAIDQSILEIGKEYGSMAIAKAHLEKITQIDALSARKADVERTLASMRQNDGEASADMNDEHILRATLLDRGLADINIEIARSKAELATLMERYTERSRQVRDKKAQIEILEGAMSDRRSQIQVLGQTGALTDQSDGGQEDTLQTIASLLEKVSSELDVARMEARALNARRVQLGFLEEERSEMRRMLDDTRAALDVIRVESRKKNPGLTDVMSEAMVPAKPADDSSKVQAVAGMAGGGMLATILVLGAGLTSRRVRWSDDLNANTLRIDRLSVSREIPSIEGADLSPDIDHLRTELQLVRPRTAPVPLAEIRGRTLAIVRAAPGYASGLSSALAKSFAKTDLSVVLVRFESSQTDRTRAVTEDSPVESFHEVSLLNDGSGRGQDMSLPTIRRQVAGLAERFDVVLLDCGSLIDSSTANLVASASDYAVVEVRRGDSMPIAEASVETLPERTLHGAGLAFFNAHRADPGLPLRQSQN